MSVGSITAASTSSAVAVTLQKSQQDQQASIVNQLIQSATQPTSRAGFSTGQRLNVAA